MLEEMRRREEKLKMDLDEREAEMRAQQQLLQEQEEERNRLASEFEAMQQQVNVFSCLTNCCVCFGPFLSYDLLPILMEIVCSDKNPQACGASLPFIS